MTDSIEAQSSRAVVSRYLQVVRRQWWLIAVAAVVALAAAGAYVAQKQPVYASTMKIVVGQGRALFGADASGAFQPFTQTMTDLLESDVVARRAIQEQGLDIAPNELLSRMTVSSRPDTSVLQVTYEDTDRARATQVLASIGTIFTGLVNQQLAQQTQDTTQDGSATEPVSATVFDPAHAVPGQVTPRPKRTLAIAVVLGLVAGVLLALLRDGLSSRIRTEEEAREAFGAQVVGLLPPGTIGTTPAQVAVLPHKLSARVSESLQLLTATMRYGGEHADSGIVLVTSARPGDGKTSVVAHISAVLARSGASVIAVEADMRRPALHRFFGFAPGRRGLAEVLTDGLSVSDALVRAKLDESRISAGQLVTPSGSVSVRRIRRSEGMLAMSDTDDGVLDVMLAGAADVNPSQALSLGRSAEVLAQLRELADFVVLDTPPLLLSADPFPLAQLADQVLVVCREGATSRDEARSVRASLATLGVKRFSVVLTESRSAQRRAYGYAYE